MQPPPSGASTHSPEACGAAFSLARMLTARTRTFEAVDRIAAAISPGMTEGEATALAMSTLEAMNMERIWHKVLIRFGEGTTKEFLKPGDPDRALGTNDIFFVDLGVVWNGHEGDAGDTFVVGADPEMQRCAQDAREIWHAVAAQWRSHGLSGKALYDFAAQTASAKGWHFNWDTRGHRVSDFPHAIYKAPRLSELAGAPANGLWIMEIQIAHPSRPFGAFYEDLLLKDPASQVARSAPRVNP